MLSWLAAAKLVPPARLAWILSSVLLWQKKPTDEAFHVQVHVTLADATGSSSVVITSRGETAPRRHTSETRRGDVRVFWGQQQAHLCMSDQQKALQLDHHCEMLQLVECLNLIKPGSIGV